MLWVFIRLGPDIFLFQTQINHLVSALILKNFRFRSRFLKMDLKMVFENASRQKRTNLHQFFSEFDFSHAVPGSRHFQDYAYLQGVRLIGAFTHKAYQSLIMMQVADKCHSKKNRQLRSSFNLADQQTLIWIVVTSPG